ncbi:hypothetical protein F4805DRAFT_452383 [Annulohypoxylon moriforme]|nr:hypothetical protein F4805DRAFT_452383 [Annulohypoxylon moriforme]
MPPPQPPLFNLPPEIFDQIIALIDEPHDYFHLAATNRMLWITLDPRREVLLLEARQFDAHIAQWRVTSIRRAQLTMHPYNSILNWVVRTRQPIGVIRNQIQDYIRYAPRMIYGNIMQGIPPAWSIFIRLNNDEALQLFMDLNLDYIN